MIRKVMLRVVIVLALVSLIAGAFGCATQAPPKKDTAVSAPAPQKSGPPDQVIFNLNWLPEEPAYWVALDKGFWAEQNLDVKIIRGYGSGDTIAKIATKKAEFGLADIGTLIVARAKDDIKVKAVANFKTYLPAIIIYNKASGIKEPGDLEGKTIVGTAGSAYHVFFLAFAQATGIDESKVKWKFVEPALQQVVFLRGEVDAWTGDIGDIPYVQKLTGEPVRYFSYKDHGKFDRYGDCIIVHEDTVAQNPDLVRRFNAGLMKGLRYCLENPAEAGAITKRHVPELDMDLFMQGCKLDLEQNLYANDESLEKGLGWMSKEKMERTIGYVSKAYKVQKEIAPGEIFTTDLLPKEPVYPPGK